jgi:hypothetical protein
VPGAAAVPLGLVALVLVLASVSAARATSTQSPGVYWLAKSSDLALIKNQAAAVGVSVAPFTWVGCGGMSDPIRCRAKQQPIYTDYWSLRSKADTGWHGTAIFDIEPWSYTPAAQRADPAQWICKAAELQATDRHLGVIITPYAKAPAQMIAEDVVAAQCGAYAVDIQSQFLNGNPSAFTQFIRSAVAQIRKANKHIIILAGLATNDPAVQSPANLLADYNAALSAGVAGFWLNANNWSNRNMCAAAQGGPGCPAVGLQLLTDANMTSLGP